MFKLLIVEEISEQHQLRSILKLARKNGKQNSFRSHPRKENQFLNHLKTLMK